MNDRECTHAFIHEGVKYIDTLSTGNNGCVLRKYLDIYRCEKCGFEEFILLDTVQNPAAEILYDAWPLGMI